MDLDKKPVARFHALENPLWVVNPEIFHGQATGSMLPDWLHGGILSGREVIFMGESHVVKDINTGLQWLQSFKNEARCLVAEWKDKCCSGLKVSLADPFLFGPSAMVVASTEKCDKKVHICCVIRFSTLVWCAKPRALAASMCPFSFATSELPHVCVWTI